MTRQNANSIRVTTAEQDRGGIREISRSLTVAARGGSLAAAKPAAATHSNASSHIAGALPDHRPSQEPTPVWLAALVAAPCFAHGIDLSHEVRWQRRAGRAVYTNFGGCSETIEPLGVVLQAGETLAVYWIPGDTAYTLEVCSKTEMCA
jgi:hypothetical protein